MNIGRMIEYALHASANRLLCCDAPRFSSPVIIAAVAVSDLGDALEGDNEPTPVVRLFDTIEEAALYLAA